MPDYVVMRDGSGTYFDPWCWVVCRVVSLEDGIYIPISRYADKMTRQELGRLLWSVRRGEVTG